MDVLNRKIALDGEDLIDTVVAHTGLPAQDAEAELSSILARNGSKPDGNLTIDELRAAMVAYLEAIHESMMAEEAAQSTDARMTSPGDDDPAVSSALLHPIPSEN